MEVPSALLIGITNRDIFIVCNMMEGGARRERKENRTYEDDKGRRLSGQAGTWCPRASFARLA
jgi:hypothetical protein